MSTQSNDWIGLCQGRNRVNIPCPCQKPNRVSENRVCRSDHVFVPCKPCRAKCRVNRAVSTECGRVSRVLPTVPTTTDLPAVPCKPCQLLHVFYIYIDVYIYIYMYHTYVYNRSICLAVPTVPCKPCQLLLAV